MKIEELDFTVRTYNVLKRAGIDTVEQLQQKSDDDLYKIRNIGVRCVTEIRSKLPCTKTIADRIRSMNDDELRNFLCGLMNCSGCAFGSSSGCKLKDWLQSPSKEEG